MRATPNAACGSSPTSSSSRARRAALAAFAAALLVAGAAQAQFAAFVLPARFELKARPGEVVREVLEIGNDGPAVAEYGVRTADWRMNADGGVEFIPDVLVGDSCRPWVKIERHTLKIDARGKRRYRFEVHVPPDAKPGLCKFAMMIESVGDVANVTPMPTIQVPIQGRIAVIVYVRVGDAKPQIEFKGLRVENVNGQVMPVVVLANSGNAHGRPQGVLSGTDAQGRPVDLTVASLPVLPGATRAIPLWPAETEGRRPGPIAWPLTVRGRVDWEGGQRDVEATLGP